MRDKGELVTVMSLDLSKAFDFIPHSLPLAKLKAYGFGEESCASQGDYLNDRSQSQDRGFLLYLERSQAGNTTGKCSGTYVI